MNSLRATPEVGSIWNEWSREAGIALKSTHSQARRLLELIDTGDLGRNRAAPGREVGEKPGERPGGKLGTSQRTGLGGLAHREHVCTKQVK